MREFPPYDDETLRLIDRGMRDMIAKNQSMNDAWKFGEIRWDLDFNQGTIKFTSPGMVALAPVQVIGSLIEETGSWLWSWANPSIDRDWTGHARLVRHFGRQRAIEQFDTPELICTKDHAWEFTALACHLADSHGGYFAVDESGGPQLYMTFGIPQVFRHNVR